jgi:hypothetical protein
VIEVEVKVGAEPSDPTFEEAVDLARCSDAPPLARALAVALHPDAPDKLLQAALRYYAETEADLRALARPLPPRT